MKNGKFIKRAAFLTVIFCLFVFTVFGQKPIIKSARRNTPPPPSPAVKEISAADWKLLTDALDKEDWAQASLLAALDLKKLRADNEKKQLARLRYFYVYALAGKTNQGKMTFAELEKTVGGFTGKEFLMPSRQISEDCAGKVNFICPVKNNPQALRATATDKSGAAIHDFEYVRFSEDFDLLKYRGKTAFLGGKLQKVEKSEFTNRQPGLLILRLVFDQGFIRIVID